MAAPARITKATDKQLVQLANELFHAVSGTQILVHFSANSRQVYDGEIDKSEFDDRAYFVTSIEVVFQDGNQRVIIARGRYANETDAPDANRFRTQRVSSNFDEYWVGGTHRLEVAEAKAIERILSKFRAVAPVANDAEGVVALLSSHIEQLRELELQFHAKQFEAEEEHRKRRAELDRQAEEREAARLKDFEVERQELQKLRDDLNDREPQHERRRLRKDLTGEIKQLLSDPPKKGFWEGSVAHTLFVVTGVSLVFISLILTGDLGAFFALGSNGAQVPTEAFWVQAAKSIAAGFAGGGFLWAGLSGIKKSEEAQKDNSRRLQRYSHDMDRASWVVETLLQLNATESAQIPDVWLEAVCNQLFDDESSSSRHQTDSLEALGALLDATTRARVGTDGFEFELDRKRTRQLAKSSVAD